MHVAFNASLFTGDKSRDQFSIFKAHVACAQIIVAFGQPGPRNAAFDRVQWPFLSLPAALDKVAEFYGLKLLLKSPLQRNKKERSESDRGQRSQWNALGH